jgi:hypothetical protein
LSSVDIFLKEIRDQYNRELDEKKSLDDTASSMILIVGTTTGFPLTLAAAILVKLNPKYEFFRVSVVLLLAGIVINIIAIYLFLLVPRIRSYLVIMGYHVFFGPEEILKEDILHQFETAEPKALNNNLIYSYMEALKTNSKLNNNKSEKIGLGQIMFFVGVAVIIISTGFQLFAFLVHAINP